MKKLTSFLAAGTAASGLVLAMMTAMPAAAADQPCAQMGKSITILNEATPTCLGFYTSGSSSIVLPSNAPRIVYGVVNMIAPGVAPTTVTDQNGTMYSLNPTEGKRWLAVGPQIASQTIVKAEIVNNRIGRTFPYLYITDDAVTDRFESKSFIGRTKNSSSAKKPLSIWMRMDWASGVSADGGLKGTIVNYKRNITDAGQCKPSMVSKNPDRVKQRFGSKGKVQMKWNAGLAQGDGSYLILKTETAWVFTHKVPTALQFTRKVWKPTKLFFTLSGSQSGLTTVGINDIRKASKVKECTLP